MKLIRDKEKEQREKAERKNKFLLNVGYHNEGVYVLKFPNGKSYVGSSKEMGKRLQQLFRELFSVKKNQVFSQDWIKKAKEENPQIKSFSDLTIDIYPRETEQSLSELKKQIKMKETSEGRHIY